MIVLFLLAVIGLGWGTFSWVFDYGEHNMLTSEMTEDVRHPQHIKHARFLVRTNVITGGQCVVKRDGDATPTQLDHKLKPCTNWIIWDFLANNKPN